MTCGRRVARHACGALVLLALAGAACRPMVRSREDATATRAGIARGAALYAGYCAGCHGADGRGDGPVAANLRLRPADLRDPTLLALDDRALVGRISAGEPLRTAPRRDAADDVRVDALLAYVATLSSHDWPAVRAGRYLYETSCAPCHGVYGTGHGILADWTDHPPANLGRATTRYTDAGLIGVMRHGVGTMPPMGDFLRPAEQREIVGYIRILSPGYGIYDTYCAGCHGDDGRGVHPEDLASPAVVAPPIDSAALARLDDATRRARVEHMFRRERGVMPHFRDTLDESELRDVLAYLRARSS